MSVQKLVMQLAECLSQAGIDVAWPLQLSWYNEAIPEELGARIKPSGRAGSQALVLLVGNSKLVWPQFLEACSAADSGLLASEHPFNEYVMSAVEASLRQCADSHPRRIYWSHERTDDLEGDCHFVAMQRMADAAGLAYLDNDSHLCLHPKFGPWFSLRAAVVFDDVVWDGPRPRKMRNPMCPTTRHYVRLAMESAIHCAERRVQRVSLEIQRRSSLEQLRSAGSGSGRSRSQPPPARPACAAAGGVPPTAAALLVVAAGSPHAVTESTESSACSSRRSSGDCLAAREASAEYGFAVHDAEVAAPPPKPTMDAVRSTWRKWLAVRDAPCPGHPWRYCEDQIAYHYTADRQVLLQALVRRQLESRKP